MGSATSLNHSLPLISAAMNFGSYAQRAAAYDARSRVRFDIANSRPKQASFGTSRLGGRSLLGGISLPVTHLWSKPQVGFGIQ